jgi:TolB protein
MHIRLATLLTVLVSLVLLSGCAPAEPTPTPAPTPIPTAPAPEPGSLNGQIVFSSDRDGNYELYVMNADGSDVRRLTTSSGVDYLPAWSPDGTHIAFISKRGGQSDVYVMDADGSNLRRLTDDRADEMGLDWRP